MATDFKVDIPALAEATAKVQRESANIKQTSQQLRSVFNQVMLYWQGGSGDSFAAEVPGFVKAEQQLAALLDEAVHRMKLAHDNYVDAEKKNVSTLTEVNR